MSNLPGKITDPHLSAEEPLTFRRCLRFILQAPKRVVKDFLSKK